MIGFEEEFRSSSFPIPNLGSRDRNGTVQNLSNKELQISRVSVKKKQHFEAQNKSFLQLNDHQKMK